MGRKAKEENLTLKYNGWLDGAKTVYLHYGIGETWDGISECKMRKLKNCYKTEVTIPTGADLNFCFRDEDGNWDNNSGCDYTYNSFNENTPIYGNVEIAPVVKKK